MATDLVLAILHHLLVFSIAAIIAAELAIVRPGLKGEALGVLGRIDGFYGLFAMLVIIIGAARVFYGLKGWEYYIFYWAFWAKMASFAVVGLLSIAPTVRIIRWRKAAADASGFTVPDSEVRTARTYLKAEAAVFLLIPIFAAIMARGVGY
jgi:putative membrane protein